VAGLPRAPLSLRASLRRARRLLFVFGVGYFLHLPYLSLWKTVGAASPAERALLFACDALQVIAATQLFVLVLQWVAGRFQERGDARAIFPDIYAVITRTVRDGIAQGLFLEPDFISRLAGCFASLYVETLSRSLAGTAQDSSAWGLAYERARAEGSLPAEHAGLGISAHINFDLALGIYQTITRLGAESDPAMLARFKHDHDAVNVLLEKSLPECLMRLAAHREPAPLRHAPDHVHPQQVARARLGQRVGAAGCAGRGGAPDHPRQDEPHRAARGPVDQRPLPHGLDAGALSAAPGFRSGNTC